MRTSDFDYSLPPELIAQVPIEPRDAARMLVMHRQSRTLEHRHFIDLPDYLVPGDVLVLNRTRVIPARIWARKVPSGGKLELLLLRRLQSDTWEALVRGRRARPGSRLELIDPTAGEIGPELELLQIMPSGARVVRFLQPAETWLRRHGQTPLPPYIHEHLADPERYQTVFGDSDGSAAAPTAGLHFTPRVLDAIRGKGVQIEEVTLHIGLDTFRPIKAEHVEDHAIHSEWCDLPEDVASRLSLARAEGRRVVAVGTTAVRVLESAAAKATRLGATTTYTAYQGETSLYIVPGYRFLGVDALLTNFHLPRSTLLLLVSAFAGREFVLGAYAEAIRERYRFFSFGDCCLIL